jgi:hypothetical protein
MATFTANYNLRKPAGGDLVTVAADINANMDIIDAELDDHEDRLDIIEALEFIIIKPSDESVTSSTTLQNDNHLNSGTLQPGTYILEWFLQVTGADAGDISLQHTFTGTMTINMFTQGFPTGAVGVSEFSRCETGNINDTVSPTNSTNLGTITGQNVVVFVHMLAEVSATGAITLTWAQNTSNGTATTVKAGSHLVVRKIA